MTFGILFGLKRRDFLLDLPFEPYALNWAKYRGRFNPNSLPEARLYKVKRAHYVKQFETALIEAECDKSIVHIDNVDRLNKNSYSNILTYSEGTPNFHHFILTLGGMYSPISGWGWDGKNNKGTGVYNPFFRLYKNCDVDSNIINFYKGLTNSKFEANKDLPSINLSNYPDKFDVFALQWPTWIDKHQTIDAFRYAKERKKYVLFCTHPTSNGGNDKSIDEEWKVFKKLGVDSPYAIKVKNTDTLSLIPHCQRVFSSCSAVNFLGLLYNKPTASYRNMLWSEVSPVISNASLEFDNLEAFPEEEVKRFLTWMYYKLSIDLHDKNYKEKIFDRLYKYRCNYDLEDILSD